MVHVYFYIPEQDVPLVVECGLSLQQWADKEGNILGGIRRCLTAYLDPVDAPDCFRKDCSGYMCLKLSVAQVYCRVADADLYEIGKFDHEIAALFWERMLPVSDYIFGTFAKPVVLVTSTIIPGRVFPANLRRDSLRLSESNEAIYRNNLIDRLERENPNIKNDMLYEYYSRLVKLGYCKESRSEDSKLAVFTSASQETSALTDVLPVTLTMPGKSTEI